MVQASTLVLHQYFTLLHEFWWNPVDSDWNVGILWNSIRNPSGISFQQIPSSFHQIPRAIPSHSKPFHRPFHHIPSHSTTFQAIPPHSKPFQVVFAGPVHRTEKNSRTELNRTMVRSIFLLRLPKFGAIPVAGCRVSKIF